MSGSEEFQDTIENGTTEERLSSLEKHIKDESEISKKMDSWMETIASRVN